jgi:hypothetical protein
VIGHSYVPPFKPPRWKRGSGPHKRAALDGRVRELALAITLALVALSAMGCRAEYVTQVIGERHSPDGRWKAVVFLRRCGNTSQACRSTTDVSVLGEDTVTVGRGNALEVQDNEVNGNNPVEVRLEWKAPERLVIWYQGSSKILNRRSSVGRVRVECNPIGSM